MSVDREELRDERDFLLRSLDDLEEEFAAGNIDDDTYRTLHDDYTARAARVIQSLDDGVSRDAPEAPEPSRMLRFLTVGGIIVFCVVAAFLLAHAVGERRTGQTITGNAQAAAAGPTDPCKAPKTYDEHVACARLKMGSNDYFTAIQEYTAAARLDPKQAEPYAYRGWLSALTATSVPDQQSRNLLLNRALSDMNQALAVNSQFTDTYVFKGLTLFQIENKPKEAVPVLQQFLTLAPQDHPMRAQVLQVLSQAENAAKSQP
jgi:tetratricopeptide (TPR) repeat protein